MLLDETCFFLAADFDKEGWREDAAAFVATCRGMNLPFALERSRSGNGAHVWLFFEEALPAALARKLGSMILTKTMERRPEVGSPAHRHSVAAIAKQVSVPGSSQLYGRASGSILST